ncbi:thiol reductant ABC exporter subunit CydD [Paracidovorax cattleyae]|uniref:ATP-binding cassette, subfamily C, CydD n=2 Tax=Paracidovorax cattleyae TaxID=80868 RepID=A0A1H0UZZ1_9BURK|nr:thiol reductant ABC exporter subunit CydD [Paracidovorax cattleyae]SDP71508.1 ATP-binding cassette, subfamily C, CydD [Paracidovorax cattleyae]
MPDSAAAGTPAAHAPATPSSLPFDPPPGYRTGAACVAAASLLWMPQAALLAWAVHRLSEGGGWQSVAWPAAAYAALGIARATAEAWGGRRVFAASRRCISQLREQACAALAGRSPLDRGRPASGLAANAVAEQADALLPWLLRYETARWRVMAVPPVMALAVAGVSWAAALILVAAAPLIPAAMALIGWRAQAASAEQLQALGGMNGFLLDRLRGLSTLRALGAVDATALRLRASAEDLRQRTMRVLRIAFLSSASLELFSALAVAFVAVYVGFHLLGQIGMGSWGRPLGLGQGLFILLLAPAFFEPLRDLSAAWHDRAAGRAALEALAALHRAGMPLPGALDDPASAPECAAPRPPAVDIEGLCFAHPGGAAVFEKAHWRIGAGEHVALVGASGAGKSTLLSIIAGLVPAGAGTVRIGGVPLDESSAASLRARMAWVGQKPHVFAGSLHDNVTLHRPGLSRREVAAALRHAGLERSVSIAPDIPLGESGAGLSGGETVRLALARATATPQAGLWLLDEPTAHLDRETSLAVADSLARMAQGRTLIVATHDRALAARIGRVIDIGPIDAACAYRRAA